MEKVNDEVNIKDYVCVDEQAVTSEVLSDDDIVSCVMQINDSSSPSIVCKDDIDTDESHPVVSATEVQEAVSTLRRFFG